MARQNTKQKKCPLVLDAKETADGNIELLMNGKELLERINKNNFEINLLDEENLYKNLKSSPTLMMIQKILSYENRYYRNYLENNNDILAHSEKLGFKALEIPIIKNYFKELVHELRDDKTANKKLIENRLGAFVRALTSTVKKKIIGRVANDNFLWFDYETQLNAKLLSQAMKEICKKKNCKKAPKGNRRCAGRSMGCEKLIKSLCNIPPQFLIDVGKSGQ